MNALAEAEEVQPGNVVTTDSASLMEVISRAARDPNTDVDKLERLMGLYERISSRNAEQAFNEAMKACQAEMPRILRNKKNTHTSSTYADLDMVIKTIVPIYTKHGFALSFGNADGAPLDHYRVTCIVSHSGGHSRDYHADVPADTKGAKGADTKTATHGFGSSMSYGRRYLTLLIFNLSTTDDDDGNAAAGKGDKAAKRESGRAADNPNWRGPLKMSALKDALRELDADLWAVEDSASFLHLLNTHAEVLNQCPADLPSWWARKDNGVAAGLKVVITTQAKKFDVKAGPLLDEIEIASETKPTAPAAADFKTSAPIF